MYFSWDYTENNLLYYNIRPYFPSFEHQTVNKAMRICWNSIKIGIIEFLVPKINKKKGRIVRVLNIGCLVAGYKDGVAIVVPSYRKSKLCISYGKVWSFAICIVVFWLNTAAHFSVNIFIDTDCSSHYIERNANHIA